MRVVQWTATRYLVGVRTEHQLAARSLTEPLINIAEFGIKRKRYLTIQNLQRMSWISWRPLQFMRPRQNFCVELRPAKLACRQLGFTVKACPLLFEAS